MMRTGLIGWPLGHSFSPSIHNLAFKMAGIDGEYVLNPIDPLAAHGLANVSAELRAGEFTGLNVTIPHKIAIAKIVDELTPIAERVGAVNTIHMENGKLIGGNTDAPGFSLDLKRKFGKECYRSGKALIFGGGGSARAVITALVDQGVNCVVAVRNPEKAAQELIGSGGDRKIGIVALNDVDNAYLSTFELFINTTPMGMSPNLETSVLKSGQHFPKGGFVYDLVYNPAETVLFKQAVSDGCKAVTGFGMLVEQALEAFELWTGVRIDRDEFYARYNAIEENK